MSKTHILLLLTAHSRETQQPHCINMKAVCGNPHGPQSTANDHVPIMTRRHLKEITLPRQGFMTEGSLMTGPVAVSYFKDFQLCSFCGSRDMNRFFFNSFLKAISIQISYIHQQMLDTISEHQWFNQYRTS